MKIKPAKLIKRFLLILILLLFALFFPLRIARYIAACTLGIAALSVLYSRISILFLYAFREIDIVRGHRVIGIGRDGVRRGFGSTIQRSLANLLPNPWKAISYHLVFPGKISKLSGKGKGNQVILSRQPFF